MKCVLKQNMLKCEMEKKCSLNVGVVGIMSIKCLYG